MLFVPRSEFMEVWLHPPDEYVLNMFSELPVSHSGHSYRESESSWERSVLERVGDLSRWEAGCRWLVLLTCSHASCLRELLPIWSLGPCQVWEEWPVLVGCVCGDRVLGLLLHPVQPHVCHFKVSSSHPEVRRAFCVRPVWQVILGPHDSS